MPQAPQLFGSVFVFVQVPLQQACPEVQTVPHEPQWLVVSKFVQVPLQQPWPELQTVPHAPQWLVVVKFVQVPLQQP